MSRHRNRKGDYRIHLNLMPIAGDLPDFTVYRRVQATPDEERPHPDILAYRLPTTPDDDGDWQSYWISMGARDSFDAFRASQSTMPALTRRVLFHALESAAQTALQNDQYRVPKKRFLEAMEFVHRVHPQGDEVLVVQPYYLRATRQFGYLLDFRFRLRDGVAFDRKVQQLSLSLDGRFRRNVDYYIDRSRRVSTMFSERADVFSSLQLPDGQAFTLVS